MIPLALLVVALSAAAEQTPHPQPTDHSVAKKGSANSAEQDSTKPQAPITPATPSAEERLADYTRMLTLFTGGLVAATLLLWLTTRGTLQHLRREFQVEYRPWIPPEIELASGWTWTPQGEGRVTLRFTLRNIGRSPATNVDVRTEIFPYGLGFLETPAAVQKKLSQSKRRDALAPGEGMGWTIFPNSAPRYVERIMSIGAVDLEKSRLAWKEAGQCLRRGCGCCRRGRADGP